VDAKKDGNRLVAATFEGPGKRRETIPARAFVDATYEGDLMALSGAEYRVGRESSAEYNEEHAGVLYFDVNTYTKLPGSTGEGDKRVQAYNYRLPLTNRSGHRYYAVKPPEGYDRENYANIPEDVKAGRVPGISRVIHFRRVPGEEFDVNNHRYYPSTDYVGHSNSYPDASPEERKRIAEEHRRHIEGLIYFLQNDPELPASFRYDANQWGFAQDEFRQNERFPTQLYVREARRMVGETTFTENDARLAEGSGRTPVFADSIGVGEYMMDSHATRPQEPDRPMGVLEGFYFIPHLTKPYQIPYRMLVPKTVDGLLVPFATSATHAGFGTLRMEPVMMALGEAAGVATQIARKENVRLRNVPMWQLHRELLENKAVLTFFEDLSPDRPEFEAYQYLGTLGLFDDYRAAPDAPLDRETARRWFGKVAESRGKAPAMAENAPWNGGNGGSAPLTRSEAQSWLAALYPGVSIPLARNEESAAITRGEVVRALYDGVKASRSKG
ncbi:MAG: FAD-dependent oxidoreductase, partial [Armatimonadetes bacterium]|nr:FAD-dependent oxidoreductase [Armatimonadota bacterium]